MKRIMLIGLLFSSNNLLADTILGGEFGANYWNYGIDGAFSDSQNLTDFDFNSTSEMVFYASLEHPLPLVPNLKIRNNPVSSDGDLTLASDFDFLNVTFPAGSDLSTRADLTNRDLILYYEVLDNRLVSLDLGATFKWFDGSLGAASLTTPGMDASQQFAVVVPMIYGKVRADLWGTGLYGSAEANYVGVSDNQLSDYQVALGYALIDNLAFAINIEAGYRVMDLRLENVDDIYANFKMDGAWLGVVLDF